MEIIPALVMMHGRVFKSPGPVIRSPRSDGPLQLAYNWRNRGAVRIYVVNLDRDQEVPPASAAAVLALAATRFGVYVGGGIRHVAQAERFLALGAEAVVVRTAGHPARLKHWVGRIGRSHLVPVLDPAVHDGDPDDLEDWMDRRVAAWQDLGLRRIIVRRRVDALARPYPSLSRLAAWAEGAEVYVEGGVQGPGDLAALAQAGVQGAIVRRAWERGTIPTADVWRRDCPL
jgi:phosphoribosylformimino-5-aminoimidazole carboxamide ribotide isomerase